MRGKTPAELAFRFDPSSQTIRFRALFEPTALKARLPAIHVEADRVRGKVIIDNRALRLQHLHGQMADGEIQVNGQFLFSGHTLELALDVRNLDTNRLPRRWSLAPEVAGRLDGHIKLQIGIIDGKPDVSGRGRGMLAPVRTAGKPTKSIPLTFRADRLGLHVALDQATSR